jgi:hypothetical protein
MEEMLRHLLRYDAPSSPVELVAVYMASSVVSSEFGKIVALGAPSSLVELAPADTPPSVAIVPLEFGKMIALEAPSEFVKEDEEEVS